MKNLIIILILNLTILVTGCGTQTNSSVSKKESENIINENKEYVARAYFEAVATGNIEEMKKCFAGVGSITIEGRNIDSEDSYSGFFQSEVKGGVYEIYRAVKTDKGIKILLQFMPQGGKEPKPIEIYDFVIEDNIITKANIWYATEEDKEAMQGDTLENSSLIPDGFTNYLIGVEVDDAKKLAEGFTDDAEVIDVSRTIRGKEAITKWADREVLNLEYTVGKIIYTDKGAKLYNNIKYGSGNFIAEYDLELHENKIQRANLQYSDEEELNYLQ